MQKGIQIFKNEELGEIRVIAKNGQSWIIAKDVATILEYTDAEAMTRRLDDDEKLNLQIVGIGQARSVIGINESGFYNAVLGSKKLEAKKFRKWVTSEVLPSIMKTGKYNIREQSQNISELREFNKMVSGITNKKLRNSLYTQRIEKMGYDVSLRIDSKEDNDNIILINKFLVENCTKVAGARFGVSTLYEVFGEWNQKADVFVSPIKFSKILNIIGIEKGRSSKGRYWQGLKLLKKFKEASICE